MPGRGVRGANCLVRSPPERGPPSKRDWPERRRGFLIFFILYPVPAHFGGDTPYKGEIDQMAAEPAGVRHQRHRMKG